LCSDSSSDLVLLGLLEDVLARPGQMGLAGFLEFKPESQVTVSVMTQAGPGSRSAATVTADHDHVMVLFTRVSEKLSEARLDDDWIPLALSVRLRVMILNVILRSRGNFGCAGRPGGLPGSPGCGECRRAGAASDAGSQWGSVPVPRPGRQQGAAQCISRIHSLKSSSCSIQVAA
jgi:hypothetical protein